MSWQDRAACRGRRDLDWFIERIGRSDGGRCIRSGIGVAAWLRVLLPPEMRFIREQELAELRAMAALCAGCPVRQQCRRFAIEEPSEVEGVWGGMWFGLKTGDELRQQETEPERGQLHG